MPASVSALASAFVSALVWVASLAGALAQVGCQPSLPDPPSTGVGGAGGAPSAEPRLHVEPPSPLDAVPRAVRLRVEVLGPAPDPARCVLATGELGDAHLRQLADADISGALTERLLPVRSWVRESDDGQGILTIAPARLLDAGETYTVACGEPPLALAIVVAAEDAAPVLQRAWPPAGGSATTDLEIWCGDVAMPELDVPASLEPAGPSGTLRSGAGSGVPPRCVRFDASAPATGSEAQPSPFEDAPGVLGWLPPVAIGDGGPPGFALEPAPLARDTEPPEVPAASCDVETPLPFGPGCAALLDDRAVARAPAARMLWHVRGTVDWLGDVASGAPFVVAPLPPGSAVSLDVSAIDIAGRATTGRLGGTTLPAMAHVVLGEVLANPLGAEPQQEWVELHNAGLAPAELLGMVIADIGGEAVLPEASLPPGGFALVVAEAFLEDDGLDPPVPPGTLLLRVEKLGKSGLSNSGEPLELRDASGVVLSRFPAAPKPKPGGSVARVDPLAPDGVASSFAHARPTPAAANELLVDD